MLNRLFVALRDAQFMMTALVLCTVLALGVSSARAATVAISANPVSVSSGSASMLTWTSTDATSCAASGAWSGVKATSGSQSVSPQAALSTYTLNCGGPSGSASGATVIGAGTPAPAIYTLTANVVGQGVISSAPQGIVCPGDCTQAYATPTQLTLSAVAATGQVFSGWSGDCSGVANCVVTMQAARTVTATFSAAPNPADLLFFDNFEYEVSRNVSGAATAFAAHGWDWAKTNQDGANANGYVYTTNAAPGYTGPFPGRSSNRVLVLEALPASLNGQTDFFLQFGSPTGAIGQIPPKHWFQFWVYSPATDTQRSVFTAGKFIYPNRADFYPATLSNGGYVYVTTLGKDSSEPLRLDCAPGQRNVPCDRAYLGTYWNDVAGLTNNEPYGSHRFGQNLGPEASVARGQWTLVKMHVDLTGTDPRAAPGHAVYEQWIRRLGTATWTKTTEWIGGVTQNAGAPIQLQPAYTDGFRMFRIPTTIGGTTSTVGDWYDYWLYIDDFAMARSEAALPQYP